MCDRHLRWREAAEALHSAYALWHMQKEGAGDWKTRSGFLEHLLRCIFLFSLFFHSLKIIKKTTNRPPPPPHFWFQDKSQEKVRMHYPWAVSKFLFILIKIILTIWPWAGQMCLLSSRRLRSPGRLHCLFSFVPEPCDFLTCAIPRVISLPLFIY